MSIPSVTLLAQASKSAVAAFGREFELEVRFHTQTCVTHTHRFTQLLIAIGDEK
jgi:hypothetical protein